VVSVQASACCKHYVANSMDSSTVAGEHHERYEFNANVTDQDLVDSYLLPFQACVEKGHVSGLMCSYNAVNGVPSCANTWLLQTVARDAWGFDGYITSDCDADANVYDAHHYTKTPEEAVAAVLHAGTDVDCTSFVGEHAQKALDQKLITEADIDKRLFYLFRVRMRLAHFDPPSALTRIPPSAACTDAHKEAARDGVRQSVTMLKNVATRLPLTAGAIQTIAVLGPVANLSTDIAGYYGGNNCNDDYPNMVDAIAEVVPHTLTAMGVKDVKTDDESGIPDAVAKAKAADVVVLCLGTDLSLASEGNDAVDITFSKGQLALLAQVTAAVEKPVIVLTFTATPLDLTPLLTNPKVGALVHVGQPSVQTRGVADVLFGHRSPGGRTIQTVYPGSYQHEISIFDFNMRPGPSVWARPDCPAGTPTAECPRGTNPGRTYRFYTGDAVIPFGFGLSFTTFTYKISASPASLSLTPLRALLRETYSTTGTHFPRLNDVPQAVGYQVTVTNTGNVDADDAVLGFLTPPNAGKDGMPIKTLFGFERVHVKAGESVTVWLYPSMTDFAFANIKGERVAVAGTYTVSFGVRETAALGMGYVEATLEARD
jgi:uncharacterized repeat protein (TIGR01451 family)